MTAGRLCTLPALFALGCGSASPTEAPTASPTSSPTEAGTPTPTAIPTATPTAIPTATPTARPTPTATPTSSPTPTPTPIPTPTAIPNRPPTLSGVSLTPALAYETSTLTCTPGAASDPDGDAVGFTFGWTIAGVTISETGATLSGAIFDKGDRVRCFATPHDGQVDGGAAISDTVVIQNSPPGIEALSLSPSRVHAGDQISALVEAYDADLDPVHLGYVWRVNEAEVSREETLDGRGILSKGDALSLEITPTDGEAPGPVASALTFVLNTAPSAPEVGISPTYPEAGVDDLVCVVDAEAVDIDEDPLTYQITWTVDDVPYPEGVPGALDLEEERWPGDTVAAEDTLPGQIWTCSAVAFDGEAEGPPASATEEALLLTRVGNVSPLGQVASATPRVLLGSWVDVEASALVLKLGVVLSRGPVGVRLTLYGGDPSAEILLAYTPFVTLEAGRNEVEVVAPVSIAPGRYWLMAAYDGTGTPFFSTTGDKDTLYRNYDPEDPPPNPIGNLFIYCCQDFTYYIVAD